MSYHYDLSIQMNFSSSDVERAKISVSSKAKQLLCYTWRFQPQRITTVTIYPAVAS